MPSSEINLNVTPVRPVDLLASILTSHFRAALRVHGGFVHYWTYKAYATGLIHVDSKVTVDAGSGPRVVPFRISIQANTGRIFYKFRDRIMWQHMVRHDMLPWFDKVFAQAWVQLVHEGPQYTSRPFIPGVYNIDEPAPMGPATFAKETTMIKTNFTADEAEKIQKALKVATAGKGLGDGQKGAIHQALGLMGVAAHTLTEEDTMIEDEKPHVSRVTDKGDSKNVPVNDAHEGAEDRPQATPKNEAPEPAEVDEKQTAEAEAANKGKRSSTTDKKAGKK